MHSAIAGISKDVDELEVPIQKLIAAGIENRGAIVL